MFGCFGRWSCSFAALTALLFGLPFAQQFERDKFAVLETELTLCLIQRQMQRGKPHCLK